MKIEFSFFGGVGRVEQFPKGATAHDLLERVRSEPRALRQPESEYQSYRVRCGSQPIADSEELRPLVFYFVEAVIAIFVRYDGKMEAPFRRFLPASTTVGGLVQIDFRERLSSGRAAGGHRRVAFSDSRLRRAYKLIYGQDWIHDHDVLVPGRHYTINRG